MGVDLSSKGWDPNLILLAAPRRKTQISFHECGNNGITIVNAIAKSVR